MTYAIIPLATAAVCIWLGRRILAVLVFFSYLSLEGFFKLVSDYNPVVHVGADIVLLSMTAVWIMAAVVARKASLPRPPFISLLLLHVAWTLLMLLHPLTASLFVGLASLKIHLTMIPLYFIGYVLVDSREDGVSAVTGLVAIAYVPFVAALGQYALGPRSVLDLSDRYWENISTFHEWRPFGTSATPGGTATFAFLTVPLAVALLLSPGLSRRARLLSAGAVLLGAGCFMVAGGRQLLLGCLLALGTMATMTVARRRSRTVFVATFVGMLGAGGYVGVQSVLQPLAMEAVKQDPRAPKIWRERPVVERFETLMQTGTYVEARLGSLGRVLDRIKHFPLGAGLGRTGSAGGTLRGTMGSDPMNATINREVGFSDNFFADMISETGIPGAVMLTALLVGLMAMSLKLAARAHDAFTAAVAGAVGGQAFAILVMSWGSQPLLGNPITAYFWFLTGLVAALRRRELRVAALAGLSPAQPDALVLAASPSRP